MAGPFFEMKKRVWFCKTKFACANYTKPKRKVGKTIGKKLVNLDIAILLTQKKGCDNISLTLNHTKPSYSYKKRGVITEKLEIHRYNRKYLL